MKVYALLIIVLFTVACNSTIQEYKNINKDTLVTIQNSDAKVSFSLYGGAMVVFELNEGRINPFTWKLNKEDMPENNKNGAPFQGHFLCTNRWGGPTAEEIKVGIPHNGEPANIWWQLIKKSTSSLTMKCEAIKEDITINRNVSISKSSALIKVQETFTNNSNFIRNIPIVQHATIGTPFLDSSTIVFSNASFGFNQSFVPNNILKYESKWPFVTANSSGKPYNAGLSNNTTGFVSTFIISDTTGWVIAYNPSLKIVLGYVWKTSEYPWVHLWHGIKNEKLWAKGLEFGTTGLGDTAPMEQRLLFNFHNKNNLNLIDAQSSRKNTYYCFQLKINQGLEKIDRIILKDKSIFIAMINKKGITTQELKLD